MKKYWVYIMTSRSRVLYTGITNSLERRALEHRLETVQGFTSRYGVKYLVHAEEFSDVRLAIAREKQIKGWSRARKLALIDAVNPEWKDLADTLPMKER